MIALPERPELAHSLRLFAAAVALDLVYVAGTATAVLAASQREHGLDVLAALGSVASSSALVAGYGLARPALTARAAERRDHQALLPLREAVTVTRQPGPRYATRWNSRYALTDLVVEILDDIRVLHPWTSAAADEPVSARLKQHQAERVDVDALTAAAAVRHARRLRDGAEVQDQPPQHQPSPSALAWDGVPATRQRAHLIPVAGYPNHPVVTAALDHLASTSAQLAAQEATSDRTRAR
ncbi:hypothetical protein GCM10011579_008560 [Streptomyces albiflavescens]|uniref:DUF6545 domain-containing protein n=1 Tax=Streptomyces albiflavescens TaxID=1623582 RepID=A0A917XTV6_9ACTN|nr:DUF6545 domain-containing protein [Streptomyces albiflavescens]GGN52024.1 hypothetical protein GCM10011579_008560 [Streptomyces albiflavescens]